MKIKVFEKDYEVGDVKIILSTLSPEDSGYEIDIYDKQGNILVGFSINDLLMAIESRVVDDIGYDEKTVVKILNKSHIVTDNDFYIGPDDEENKKAGHILSIEGRNVEIPINELMKFISKKMI